MKFIFFLCLLLLIGLVISTKHLDTTSKITSSMLTPASPTQNNSFPTYDHIIIVIMENKSYEDVLNNKSAPFLNALASGNSIASNYSAITNPSLPNYLALTGGDTFGITNDCTNCFVNKLNIIDRLDEGNKTWKAYMESLPFPCFVGDKYPYAQKHNPFIYFTNIRENKSRCSHIVPYLNLETDLEKPSQPNFIWITPNLCSDMHDCSVSIGDKWLSEQIPIILGSSLFSHQQSLLIITFDEGENNNNIIPAIFIGAHIKHKFSSNKPYTHYSLLHTIEIIWHLSPLTTNDAKSPIISDIFN